MFVSTPSQQPSHPTLQWWVTVAGVSVLSGALTWQVLNSISPVDLLPLEQQTPAEETLASAPAFPSQSVPVHPIPDRWELTEAARRIEEAAELLQDHQPRAALKLLLPLLQQRTPAEQNATQAEIWFLTAICQEAVASPEPAREAYRQAQQHATAAGPRLWAALQALRLAQHSSTRQEESGLLWRMFLESGEHLPAALQTQILLQLLDVGPPDSTSGWTTARLLDEKELAIPAIQPSPQDILVTWQQLLKSSQQSHAQRSELAGKPGHAAVTLKGNAATGLVSLKLQGEALPLVWWIREICRVMQWELTLTDAAFTALQPRLLTLATAELPLEHLLDGLLLWEGYEWTAADGRLWVMTQAELIDAPQNDPTRSRAVSLARRQARYEQAAFVLAQSVVQRQYWGCRLAARAVRTGKLPEARFWLEQLIAQDPFARSSIIRINLAKVLRSLEERSLARNHLLLAADQLDDDQVSAAAFLLAAQGLQEELQLAAAQPLLQRGLTLSQGELRGRISIQLALNHLLSSNLPAATSILSQSKPDWWQTALRDRAEFLEVWLQFQHAPRTTRMELAEKLLVRTAHLHSAGALDPVWSLLLARSWQELGLPNERDRTLQLLPQNTRTFELARLWKLPLPADAVGPHALSAVQSPTAENTLRLARTYEQNERDQELIQFCQQALQQAGLPDSTQRELLAMLGRALQRQGRHAEAVQCFVGECPASATHADTSR